MRTREKSKAQLVKELAATQELVQDRDGQIRVLLEDNAKLGDLRERVKALNTDHQTRCHEVYDLKKELDRMQNQIAELERDRDGWKSDSMKLHNELQAMRKNFFQQAALAGRLADHSFATVAPSNPLDRY